MSCPPDRSHQMCNTMRDSQMNHLVDRSFLPCMAEVFSTSSWVVLWLLFFWNHSLISSTTFRTCRCLHSFPKWELVSVKCYGLQCTAPIWSWWYSPQFSLLLGVNGLIDSFVENWDFSCFGLNVTPVFLHSLQKQHILNMGVSGTTMSCSCKIVQLLNH